ncbi:MAG: hypothetical protein E7608_05580 [Ruminococcaceae bacterium]|nr:hypothetical protein [Oscillospiraceae bacterium]
MMKRFYKALILVLVLSLAFCALCLPVSAASASGQRGATVTVSTAVSGVMGINGKISVSGNAISSYTISVTDAMSTGTDSFFTVTSVAPKTYVVTVKCTISSSANIGDTATVTISGDKVMQDGSMGTFSEAHLVTVAAATPVVTIDYSKLSEQIKIANELNKNDYTAESWEAMLAALNEARANLKSTSQVRVDASTNKLRTAIASLVKLDRTKLLQAIDEAGKLFVKNDDTKAWKDFVDAVNTANEMLTSNVQKDIDDAANALLSAVAALTEIVNRPPETVEKIVEVTKEVEKIVEVTKEVIVEVPVEVTVEVPTEPTEPFCNKTSHNVWLVLLIISAVINVAFIVLTVVYFIRKKNNHKDTTPLVNYSIEEDNK